MKKSIGQLIDEISVTNIKIFMLVETTENKKNSVEDAWKLQNLVKYRAQLRKAIDETIEGVSNEIKVYQGK